MFGSFLPNLWSSCNQSVLGSREPTLLCNQVGFSSKRPELAVLMADYVNEANSEVVARFQGRSLSMRLTG
jgi:hypothetical protein